VGPRGAGPCRVGVDLTAIAEVDDALGRFGERYLRRLYTDHEVDCCRRPTGFSAESLAARFAAKEAALKVLEPSGARPQWRDIEVVRRPSGAARIRLHGRAAGLASARGVGPMSVSLSHEGGLAVAVVVAMCDTTGIDGRDAGEGTRARGRHGDDRSDRDSDRSNGMTMTGDSTQRIRDVVGEHGRLPVDVAQLSDDDDLFQAGMTSHASVNVMLALEDAFDIEFPEAMLRKSTFASIDALRRALAALEDVEMSA
jgi:phosphopantetheine--protein transferase-like protein